MQTIEELRRKVLPLPSRFAATEQGSTNISEEEEFFSGFFPWGFTLEYSTRYADGGMYLQRNDINRLGEIASREPHFKQAGGWHTFSHNVSVKSGGYPEGAVLVAYDGVRARKVESTEPQNTKSFAENGIEIPYVVDCAVNKPGEEEEGNIPPRVLWKTVGHVYGTREGLFKLTLDYTRAQQLAEGDIVNEDSLVVGEYVGFVVVDQNVTVDAMLPITHTTEIACAEGTTQLTITNKGKCGDAAGFFYFLLGATVVKLPICRVTGGTGNYSLSFFAKAGTTFSGRAQIITRGGGDILEGYKDIKWTAIPIVPTIEEQEVEAGE